MEYPKSWLKSVYLHLLVLSITFSCVTSFFLFGFGQSVGDRETLNPATEHGECSWYGSPNKPPIRMANGAYLRPDLLTAAHRTLPIGSLAVITNVYNGRSVQVQITDRGPFVYGRIAALTPAAFSTLADLDAKVFPCNVTPK